MYFINAPRSVEPSCLGQGLSHTETDRNDPGMGAYGGPGAAPSRRPADGRRKTGGAAVKVLIEINGTPEEIAALAAGLTERRPSKGWFDKNYVPASEEQKEDGEKPKKWI